MNDPTWVDKVLRLVNSKSMDQFETDIFVVQQAAECASPPEKCVILETMFQNKGSCPNRMLRLLSAKGEKDTGRCSMRFEPYAK